MQISRLFWTCHVDTEQWHCQEHLEAPIDVCRYFISVMSTGKKPRDLSLVNKVKLGAMPQFRFPGNPEPVYTCGHLHCHK